jgi:hypothetical protein
VFIYWGLFLTIALGALLNREEHSNRSRWLFILLAAIPTILMIGLRWKVGPDWAAYQEIFGLTKFYSFWDSISHEDPGFYLLQWVLHQVSFPFWVENLICGTVLVAGLISFCRRQPNPWLAFLVAFPYMVIVIGMSGNRQSLALGFLFFALNAFEDERLVRFAVLTFVAALFHGSALLMLPLCLLAHSENELQRVALLLLTAVIGYYVFREAYSLYSTRYSMEKLQSFGVAYRLAMNDLAAVIFLLFERRFEISDRQKRLWRVLSIASLAIAGLLLIIPSSTAVDRFILYLFPLQFVVMSHLPKVLTADRKAAGQLTLAVIAYAAAIQGVFLFFGVFADRYLPYRSLVW